MNTCPDCKCKFVQPFKCTTCGAATEAAWTARAAFYKRASDKLIELLYAAE